MTFSMALPLEESTASANAIVPYILHRSCHRIRIFRASISGSRSCTGLIERRCFQKRGDSGCSHCR
jgi:hypothetical protein